MNSFAPRWVAVAALLIGQIAHAEAPPNGILIREKGKDDCCATRIELTAEGQAFCLEGGDPVAGAATYVDGKLRVEMEGEIRWTLSPEGNNWVDQEKRRWVPRESLVKIDPSWTVVRIRVVDQNKKPLDEFGYEYSIGGKDGDWDPMLVRPLPGKGGVVEIKAPNECRITLSIDHPDFNRGYGTGSELDRKKGSATLVAKFERGHTIRGKIVSDATGKPLAGATVSPLIFTPPSFAGDAGRAVVTGTNGAFDLRGVDSGFAVNHPDFQDQEIYLDERHPEKPLQVRMQAGPTIRGIVSDPANKALAGVKVTDGSGKEAITGDDGRFALKGLRRWNGDDWSLTFSKDGYNPFDFREKKIPAEGLAITLTPLPELRGQVLRADGTPVRRYHIVCGPGANPADYECVKADVEDNEGRFVVRPEKLPKEGDKYWLGIKAEGAAPWNEAVSLATINRGDFRIALKDGATLSASLAIPVTAQEPIDVALEPTDRILKNTAIVTGHAGDELATYLITMKRGEPLRIPHLRAGNYTLKITCKGASPVVRSVRMGGNGVDLGEIRLEGTGSIFGMVNEPYGKGKIWRFADGQIFVPPFWNDSSAPYLTFKTDDSGKFRVDGVPVGMITVKFDYNAAADIIEDLNREARVVEGKDTEVRFEGSAGAWKQPLRLLFDGHERIPSSKGLPKVSNVTDGAPMFRFEMTPLGSGPISGMRSCEWSADEKGGPAIDDLSPGQWRIRVFDWLGSRGFDEGWRGEVVAEIGGKRAPITLQLGSRTLYGKLTTSRKTTRLIRVIAVGKASGRVFLSRCDEKGAFVIRYLPQDEYLVHAHDDNGGWCELGRFPLDKAVRDCGEHALIEGGHAKGKIDRSSVARLDAVHIVASAPDGVEIPVDEVKDDGTYRFGQLRPGKWTVIKRSDEKEISRQAIEIRKGETVDLGQ